MIKVFVTKYALTKGIQHLSVEQAAGSDLVKTPGSFTEGGGQYFHKHEWHITEEAAKARAEEMRSAKIKSLEKSIAKIKKMVF